MQKKKGGGALNEEAKDSRSYSNINVFGLK